MDNWELFVSANNNLQRYHEQLRAVKIVIYADLKEQLSQVYGADTAMVLAAQVLNYLMGEDIEEVYQNATEPLKSKIGAIKDQVERLAQEILEGDSEIREIIVYTLRMETVHKMGELGQAFFDSSGKERIDRILEKYNAEYPIEVSPSLYSLIATRFLQERKQLEK